MAVQNGRAMISDIDSTTVFHAETRGAIVSGCVDGPNGCDGQVLEHYSLLGSGMRSPRCNKHYTQYYQRVAPIIGDITSRRKIITDIIDRGLPFTNQEIEQIREADQ
jgi:hypothetical protein